MFQETSSTGTDSSSHDFGRLQDTACRIAHQLTLIPNAQFDQILNLLERTIRSGNQQEINLAITMLSSIVKGGRAKELVQNQRLVKAMVKHFTRMAQQLQDETQQGEDTSKLQFKMLSLLSLISQIIHENKGCIFPFSKAFLNNLFTISTDCVAKSTWKKETSRILSVILEKLSERPNTLTEYGMFPRFRQILLGNFNVTEDKKSFQRLLKCVSRVNAIQPYSFKQLISSGAVRTVEKFFGKEMINHVLVRLNLQNPGFVASRSSPSAFTHLDT